MICAAASEVMDGKLDQEFVVDIFQTGSGTSTNMNANEAFTTERTVREVALAQNVLPPERLDNLLDPWRMTEPGIPEKE